MNVDIKNNIDLLGNQYSQPQAQTRFQRFVDFSKVWIHAEVGFIKEKPLKALFLLATFITSFALTIIFETVVLLYLAALFCFTISHVLRCQEIFQRIGKLQALHFINQNSIEKVKNKEIILSLKSEADHNGATNILSEPILLERYPLGMRKVSNLTQIVQAIDDAVNQGNSIKGLYINAHGSPDNIHLGEDETLNSKLIAFQERNKTQILSEEEKKKRRNGTNATHSV